MAGRSVEVQRVDGQLVVVDRLASQRLTVDPVDGQRVEGQTVAPGSGGRDRVEVQLVDLDRVEGQLLVGQLLVVDPVDRQ